MIKYPIKAVKNVINNFPTNIMIPPIPSTAANLNYLNQFKIKNNIYILSIMQQEFK
jgi:hypothetical protein